MWDTCDAYEAAKGWTAFAQQLVTDEEDSKTLEGMEVTREMALRYSTNILQLMLGTYSKATSVLRKSEKTLLAPVITKLKHLSAYTWVEMGMALQRKGGPSDDLLVFSPFVYAEAEPVMANQKVASSMCYKACIEAKEDASWAAWLNLGNVLHTKGPRTEVTLSEILPTTGEARAPKSQLYAYHCFERASQLSPTHTMPLTNMATSLNSSPATADLSDEEKRALKRELALKALAIDATCASAWMHLGVSLDDDEKQTVEVPGVGPITYSQALVKCIEYNIATGHTSPEEEACCWIGLGVIGDDVVINGKTWTERDCTLQAMSVFNVPSAWINLLPCFHEGEEKMPIKLADGTTLHMTKFEVAKRAALENTGSGSAWLNLGLCFNNIRTAELEANVTPLTTVIFDVEGTIIEFPTPQKVFLRALEADHMNWKAWINLGRTIPETAVDAASGALVLDDRTVITRLGCAQQAQIYKPAE